MDISDTSYKLTSSDPDEYDPMLELSCHRVNKASEDAGFMRKVSRGQYFVNKSMISTSQDFHALVMSRM